MRWLSGTRLYSVTAVAMGVYHLLITQYQLEGSMGWKETHLIFALVLVFMGVSLKAHQKKLRILMVVLMLLTVVSVMYLKVAGEVIETERPGVPNLADTIVGWIIVAVVLEACRRAWGPILPALALIAIAYMLFGSYLPGVMRSHPLDLDITISLLSVSHMGTGIFGMLLGISASYIFLFLLIGGLIQGTGASMFFLYIGRLISRAVVGGTALAAVATSGLVGMITGAPSANVGITGVFTIPAMKKEGIRPETAAAIEACASTGGGLIPPVLAGIAFLMMGLTGISYIDICKMAVIPGVLYFLTLGFQALLVVRKMRPSLIAETERERVDYKDMALRAPFFFVPLLTLAILLIMRFSPMYAAFWAIVSLLVVSIIMKPVRPSLRDAIGGVVSGATGGAKLGVALACVGIIVVAITGTGLGVKLPMVIGTVSGGNLLIGVLLVAITIVILGWGIPGNAAYVVTAIVAAPALVRMGISVAQVHMFIFIFSLSAAITPPVCLSVIVASGIAGASYPKAALEAVKFGFPIFLLAFLVVWAPEIMLLGTSVPWTIFILLTTMAAIFMGCLVWRGLLITEMGWLERTIAALAAGLLFAFVFARSYLALAVGCALFIVVIAWQMAKGRQKRQLIKDQLAR